MNCEFEVAKVNTTFKSTKLVLKHIRILLNLQENFILSRLTQYLLLFTLLNNLMSERLLP